jgi:hypothetical protein
VGGSGLKNPTKGTVQCWQAELNSMCVIGTTHEHLALARALPKRTFDLLPSDLQEPPIVPGSWFCPRGPIPRPRVRTLPTAAPRPHSGNRHPLRLAAVLARFPFGAGACVGGRRFAAAPVFPTSPFPDSTALLLPPAPLPVMKKKRNMNMIETPSSSDSPRRGCLMRTSPLFTW